MRVARHTSLDTREQLDNSLPEAATAAARKLSPYAQAQRDKVVEALLGARLQRLQDDGRRMRDCSTTVLLQGAAGTAARIVPNRCDSRWCALCNSHIHRKSRDRFERIKELKHTMGDERLRFITLTQRVFSGEAIGDCLDRLERNWFRFRRSKVWKDHVVGCIARFELTWSTACEGWHLHIHLVYSGSYFDQAELALHWGGVVDIRAVTRKTEAELFKYAVKTAELDGERVVEAAEALFRRKLTRFYGAYLKIKPIDVVDQADASTADRFAVSYIVQSDHIVEPGERVFYNWKRLTWVAQQDPSAPTYVREYAWKTIKELLADLVERQARAARRLERDKSCTSTS